MSLAPAELRPAGPGLDCPPGLGLGLARPLNIIFYHRDRWWKLIDVCSGIDENPSGTDGRKIAGAGEPGHRTRRRLEEWGVTARAPARPTPQARDRLGSSAQALLGWTWLALAQKFSTQDRWCQNLKYTP